MRVVLVTGKGGVGKTTIASATAILAARQGYRTIILSTDPAHSLGDVLKRRLAHHLRPVAANLDAREVSAVKALDEHLPSVRSFFKRFFRSQGVGGLAADELSILPGTEELVSLLSIEKHLTENRAGLLVVDCAPTASTLRLLALPDAYHRSMERIFPRTRFLSRLLRPVAESYLAAPVPEEGVFDDLERIDARLATLRRILTDPAKSSVRLVFGHSRTVLRETRRILSILHLGGLHVDAVLWNRYQPSAIAEGVVRRSFGEIPVFRTPISRTEPVGLDRLEALGLQTYADTDPAAVLHQDEPLRILSDGGHPVLLIRTPVPENRELKLKQVGEDLLVDVGSFRRLLSLPDSLKGLPIVEAELRHGELRVRFKNQTRCRDD